MAPSADRLSMCNTSWREAAWKSETGIITCVVSTGEPLQACLSNDDEDHDKDFYDNWTTTKAITTTAATTTATDASLAVTTAMRKKSILVYPSYFCYQYSQPRSSSPSPASASLYRSCRRTSFWENIVTVSFSPARGLKASPFIRDPLISFSELLTTITTTYIVVRQLVAFCSLSFSRLCPVEAFGCESGFGARGTTSGARNGLQSALLARGRNKDVSVL